MNNVYTLRRAEGDVRPSRSFAERHPATFEWINRKAATFDFARSLQQYLANKGDLTPGQLAAAQRCMARDVQFEAQRAQAQALAANAPAINTGKLTEAFDRARNAAAQDGEGIRHMGLRLDTFVITPAPMHGRNAGALYVKRREGNVYLGKIIGDRFMPVAACTEDEMRRLAAASNDPAAAAIAYGQRTGECSCCGRELTNAVSRARGIGPICYGRYFGG